MKMSKGYEGKKLSLHRDCIFVQLRKDANDEPRSVVLNHKTGQHFTPQNDSARMVLDLLTHNKKKHKEKGTTFDDLKLHLIRRFQVTAQEAADALNGFLADLAGFGLLNDQTTDSDPVDDGFYQPKPGNARGHIVAGGTLICVGYTINWWRP